MADLCYELAKIIADSAPYDGVNKTIVPNTHCVKFSHSDCHWQRWHSSLCIIVQGHTEIEMDSEVIKIMEFITSPPRLICLSPVIFMQWHRISPFYVSK